MNKDLLRNANFLWLKINNSYLDVVIDANMFGPERKDEELPDLLQRIEDIVNRGRHDELPSLKKAFPESSGELECLSRLLTDTLNYHVHAKGYDRKIRLYSVSIMVSFKIDLVDL